MTCRWGNVYLFFLWMNRHCMWRVDGGGESGRSFYITKYRNSGICHGAGLPLEDQSGLPPLGNGVMPRSFQSGIIRKDSCDLYERGRDSAGLTGLEMLSVLNVMSWKPAVFVPGKPGLPALQKILYGNVPNPLLIYVRSPETPSAPNSSIFFHFWVFLYFLFSHLCQTTRGTENYMLYCIAVTDFIGFRIERRCRPWFLFLFLCLLTANVDLMYTKFM